MMLPMFILDSCAARNENLALGVTSRERVALTATSSEIVVSLPVEEGTEVKQGALLVQLDNSLQLANVALAQADLARSTANLQKLQTGARDEEIAAARADVDGARAALLSARATYERSVALITSDTVSQARLDVDLAQRDSAQAALRRAEATLRELENGTRSEDIAIGEAEVAAAKAQLSAEQQKLKDLQIRASRDGVLDSLPWNLGERVTQGSPVAILLADDQLLARVYVPEPSRVHLQEGDAIQVRIDGVDGLFDGRVRWISSEPAFTPYYALNQTDRARLMYLAEIALPPEANGLAVGVPAQAILP